MKLSLVAVAAALLVTPFFALADVSVSVAALNPGSTVGVGIPVSFSINAESFDYPTYHVVDSFPGGVNSSNIDAYGNFTWTPNTNDVGSHTITVTVSDILGDTATAQQTITVVVPNVLATTPSPSSTVGFGTPVSFTLSSQGFADPTYAVADGFFNSSATPYDLSPAGVFNWTPLYQDIGVHIFTISARDYKNYVTGSVTVTVTGPAGATSSATAVVPTPSATRTPVPYVATPIFTPIPGAVTTTTATAARASTTPQVVFVSYLTVGSSGAEVTALQTKLAQLGFFSVTPTGYFGLVTRAAVQAFQQSVGLEQVGWVGPGTRAALNK